MRKQKSASEDFSQDKLPHNRLQVFLDCTKTRYTVFLRLGLIMFLFSAPFLIAMYIKNLSVANIAGQLSDNIIDEATAANMITFIHNIFNLINLPCLVIAGVGLSGVIYVLRQLIWGEGIFLGYDFFKGIKLNGIRYAVIFLIIGLGGVLNGFILYSRIDPAFVRLIPIGVSIALAVPIIMFMLTLSVVYNIKIGQCISNAVLLYIKSFPVTLGFFIIMSVPVLIVFIPNIMAKFVVSIIYMIFIFPLLLTVWLLFNCYVFDKYINKKQYPEIVDKGIYRINKNGD